MSYPKYDRDQRLKMSGGQPPDGAGGWKRIEGETERLVELEATALVRVARFQRDVRTVEKDALIDGAVLMAAALGDPGVAVLTHQSYHPHSNGIGAVGTIVRHGLVFFDDEWLDVGGLNIAEPAPRNGEWHRVPLLPTHRRYGRVLDDRGLYELITGEGWPFTLAEFAEAFGHRTDGLSIMRAGVLQRCELYYQQACTPREQGDVLARVAAAGALPDFEEKDLQSPLVEKIFAAALGAACGAAPDLATLGAIEAAIVGESS